YLSFLEEKIRDKAEKNIAAQHDYLLGFADDLENGIAYYEDLLSSGAFASGSATKLIFDQLGNARKVLERHRKSILEMDLVTHATA
ncbi:MAG TPA: hypothetical protein VK994_01315, partial [Bacteroidales bacterium]|nr:hypothetical protein [Bacteroidales bacterium]